MKLEDFGWSYPESPGTFDSFFIALSPFYSLEVRTQPPHDPLLLGRPVCGGLLWSEATQRQEFGNVGPTSFLRYSAVIEGFEPPVAFNPHDFSKVAP